MPAPVRLPLDVLLLEEGAALRAVLLALPAPELDRTPDPGDFRQAALRVLCHARAPERWAVALAGFLREKMVAVEALRTAGGARAYVDRVTAEVLAREYAPVVFDLVSGGLLPIGALPARREWYPRLLANCGDLELGTRFVHSVRLGSPPQPAELDALYALLAWEAYRPPLLAVRSTDANELEFDFELTIRGWLQEAERRAPGADRESLLLALHRSLLPYVDPADLAARVVELQEVPEPSD